MRLRNLLQVREKLDFLMAYMEFYEMIWCDLAGKRSREKKFIHFRINLLNLDHSWLNEIDTHGFDPLRSL